jgi:hypothetical protein
LDAPLVFRPTSRIFRARALNLASRRTYSHFVRGAPQASRTNPPRHCREAHHNFHFEELIMRRISVLCAAAGLAVTAFVAASPAEASYHLIRWQDTGFCQIWDESIPTTPWPSDYSRVSATVPTLIDALALKDHALKNGHCTW